MTAGPPAVADEVGPADPLDLAAYPFAHTVAARFADVDSLGHLNNVAIAAFYEDARVFFVRRALDGLAPGPLTKTGPSYVVLAEQTIRYLAEADYPGTYQVGMGVGRLGTSSVVLLAGLFTSGRCVGTGRNVLVHMVAGRPAPIVGEARARLEHLTFDHQG